MANRLEEFLAERFQLRFPRLFNQVYELIEYPIALPKNLKPDVKRLKEILSAVTEKEVTQILFFSSRLSYDDKPAWMRTQDWRNTMWHLKISCSHFDSELARIVCPDFIECLNMILEKEYLLSEETAFRGILWEKLEEDLGRKLPYEVVKTLFCYILLVVTKRPKKVIKSFKEMIKVLPYFWPIGEKRDERGVWLIRIA